VAGNHFIIKLMFQFETVHTQLSMISINNVKRVISSVSRASGVMWHVARRRDAASAEDGRNKAAKSTTEINKSERNESLY